MKSIYAEAAAVQRLLEEALCCLSPEDADLVAREARRPCFASRDPPRPQLGETLQAATAHPPRRLCPPQVLRYVATDGAWTRGTTVASAKPACEILAESICYHDDAIVRCEIPCLADCGLIRFLLNCKLIDSNRSTPRPPSRRRT